MLLIIIVIALVIVLTFRMLHWFLRPLVRRHIRWLRGSYLLMGVELIVWIGWLFWVIHATVNNRTVHTFVTVGIAFLFFGLLAWFLLRDVVAGIIFKLQHTLKINQSIRVADTSGRLLRLGMTALVLDNTSGEQIKIPYTKLINEAVARSEASDTIEPFDFSLSVSKSLSKERWIAALKQQILLLPWASAQRVPVVQWQREDETSHTFDLRVYSLNASQAQQIESHLRHKYTEKKKTDDDGI